MNIPFNSAEFFGVIEKYNSSVFPIQIIIIILGIIGLFIINSKKSKKHQFIGGFLGLLWLWTGLVYHLIFFTSINKAAFAFGGIFILQALFFFYETFKSRRLVFKFKKEIRYIIGYSFIVFGLFIYPIIGYLFEKSFSNLIVLGLPCPSTILTFGFLMLTDRKFPKYLLIIPSVWTIIGTGAATNFGVYQDYMMIIAAITANIYLIKRKKNYRTTYA